MRNKFYGSGALLCAGSFILIALTGCSAQQTPSKSTKAERSTFVGDPSKMPGNIQQQLATKQADAMQKQIAAQQTGAGANASAPK